MKYTIKDGKRNEEFEVGSEGEVLSALRLLRKKELEEFKEDIDKMVKALEFHIRDRYKRDVELCLNYEFTLEHR